MPARWFTHATSSLNYERDDDDDDEQDASTWVLLPWLNETPEAK
jgi:hypothetical protein